MTYIIVFHVDYCCFRKSFSSESDLLKFLSDYDDYIHDSVFEFLHDPDCPPAAPDSLELPGFTLYLQ